VTIWEASRSPRHALAFVMALHPRLGAGCPASELDPALVQLIGKQVAGPCWDRLQSLVLRDERRERDPLCSRCGTGGTGKMLMGCAACKKVAYNLKDNDCMTNRGYRLHCEPKQDC
jgi:hypothetical protein